MVNPFSWILITTKEAVQNEFVAIFITGIIILVLTFLALSIISILIKKLLTKDSVALPSMSIYVNIVRIIVWVVGISILLGTCFAIDLSGMVAALGIGGIAISLGFKDTISNLISGVQVTSCKVMQPGDHVQVAGHTGTVIDTTWRHTTILDMYGETIILPNSIINSNAIVKKHPYNVVRVHIQLKSKAASLVEIVERLTAEVRLVAQYYGTLTEDVKIKFSSIENVGANGSVIIKYAENIDGNTVVDIKDAIIKVIAPYIESVKE